MTLDARTLVTGGAGFVASHLCGWPRHQIQEALCSDSYSAGSWHDVCWLSDDPRVELKRHKTIFPLRAEADQVLALACSASPIHEQP